jgi:hypothetical protein
MNSLDEKDFSANTRFTRRIETLIIGHLFVTFSASGGKLDLERRRIETLF